MNYADPVDRASVEQERLLEEQLRVARNRKERTLSFIGHCHNCTETLEAPARFCDADCRDDWEKRQRSRNQTGL